MAEAQVRTPLSSNPPAIGSYPLLCRVRYPEHGVAAPREMDHHQPERIPSSAVSVPHKAYRARSCIGPGSCTAGAGRRIAGPAYARMGVLTSCPLGGGLVRAGVVRRVPQRPRQDVG
eukprot:530579-Rhodomonas_salina.1